MAYNSKADIKTHSAKKYCNKNTSMKALTQYKYL